jgi:uncharacterized protein YqgV (UPF0045/DUF77 family)
MTSSLFMALMQKGIKKGTQTAELVSALERKALSLKTTYTLRSAEVLSEDDIQTTTDAANTALEAELAEMVELSIEDLLIKTKRRRDTGKLKIQSPGLLRDKNGRIISALNLSLLLNAVLYKYVQELMGTGGRLVNRTGRLAHSGLITNIKQINDSQVSFFFRYMRAPYSTFEPGGKQGSVPRSPKALFTAAIKNALDDLLSPKGSVLQKDRLIRMVR